MLLIPSIGPTKKLIWRKKKFLNLDFFPPQNGKNMVFGYPYIGVPNSMCPSLPDQNFLSSEAKWPKEQHIQDLEHPFSVSANKSISCVFLLIQGLGNMGALKVNLFWVCNLLLQNWASSGWIKVHLGLQRTTIGGLLTKLCTYILHILCQKEEKLFISTSHNFTIFFLN